MERSHRGLLRSLGKRVYRKVSRVRIPPSPPIITFRIKLKLHLKTTAKALEVQVDDLIK